MQKHSTTRWLPLAATAGLLALGGCASGPDVRVDYDRATDFSVYKTFAFVSPLGTDRGGYQSIVSQHLKAATEREMQARGVRLDPAAPQLLVNFSATLSDKLLVTRMPMMGMGVGYYSYRGGLYSTWPLYADQTSVSQYKEGTLNIDVVDPARKQLVWEGVVTDSVTQAVLDNVPAAVNAAVKAAFAKYPVAAPAPAK
ncbi:MAG: DUF4136 domain-containing protein [Microbacteriaceae bacterium]|nr:DUF4136 domain-containing protein [Burkholderiaceae bacterium]